MSETNTSDLNEVLEEELDDATVITIPIDATLENPGEAADAYAVKQALALKADASQITGISVNGQTADQQGAILINGGQIPVSGSNTTKIDAALGALDAKTAETIIYAQVEEGTPETIKNHVDGIMTNVEAIVGLIGTVVNGTNAQSLSVPSGGWTVVSSATLEAGVWVVTGGFEMPSFAEVAAASLAISDSQVDGATSRGIGTTTKAFCVSTILELAEESTVNLRATQSSGSAKTISKLALRAVRLA